MEKTTIPEEKKEKTSKKKKVIFLAAGIVLIALAAGVMVAAKILDSSPQEPEPEVITVSTLEKIINVSELSTFKAVYNGVAQVMNKENPEETDYYVSYDAKVMAGINLEEVEISVDNETKAVNIKLPEVHITDVDVEISSLDYIFYNKKANTATVTMEAYKACEDDATNESKQQAAIIELAQQNAKNVLTALTKPFIEQVDPEYTLVIE